MPLPSRTSTIDSTPNVRPKLDVGRLRVSPMPGVMIVSCVASIALGALTGCRTTRPPLPLESPTTELRVTHYRGTPLSGPGTPLSNRDARRSETDASTRTEPTNLPTSPATNPLAGDEPDAPNALPDKTGLDAPPVVPDDEFAIRVEVTAFETWPKNPLAPLGSAAQLIVGSGDGEALRPTQTITSSWRFQTVDDKLALVSLRERFDGARRRALGVGWAALRDGMTAEFALEPRRDGGVVRVRIARHDGALGLSLGVVAPGRGVRDEETVVVDLHAKPGDGDTICCLLGPSPFLADWPTAFSFIIESMPAASVADNDTEAYALALADRKRDFAHRRNASGVGRQTAEPNAFVDAIDALTWRARRHDALRYLATETGAVIARDLVDVFDREHVRTLAERLHASTGAAKTGTTPAALGWALERHALDLVLALVAEDEEAMPPAIAGILGRHTGEVGRDPGTLRTLSRLATSRADFAARVEIENRYALEDVSPAARIRAFDWLTARDAAPPGFDPLANGKERRKQLLAAEREAEEKAADAATQPDEAKTTPATTTPEKTGAAAR